jgi:hypothetical protein
VSPCEAELGVTGESQCYNSLNTCQDTDNYSGINALTIRFGIDTGYLPANIPCVPILKNVEYTPSRISIGENLGDRAKVSAEFIDAKDTDYLFDQYLSARGIDSYNSGSFWGKFRARFPFLQRKAFRLIQGDLGQSIEEMTTRHFKIDSFNGPTTDGKFFIIAKDILKFLDGDRAQMPRLSNGFLSGSISSSDTSFTLSPAGIGELGYPSAGFLNLGGQEIVAFTRVGNAVTIARGQQNTSGVSHEGGARAQLCLSYSTESPAVIIQNAAVFYAGVPSSYINLANWQIEIDTNLAQVYTGFISEPTPVKQVVSELLQQAGLVLWDDTLGSLNLRVLRSIADSGVQLSESNILEGTMSIEDQPELRVSRLQTYFGLINPLVPLDDKSNYRSSVETINDEAETAYGAIQLKEVFSRWVPIGGRTIVERFNDLYLSQYSDPPRKFNFSTFYDNLISLAESRTVSWKTLQNSIGVVVPSSAIVTKITPLRHGFDIEAEENLYRNIGDFNLFDRVIILDVNLSNVNLRTIHDSLYPEITAQDVIDGVNLTCKVLSGVIIHSTNTVTPAFNVGSWLSGFPITIEHAGSIEGRGGKGGLGTVNNDNAALRHGSPGGLAFYTRHLVDIELISGFIRGGGGGGGAGAGANSSSPAHDGGGGGRGNLGGLGGGRGNSSSTEGTAGTRTSVGVGGPVHGGNGGSFGNAGQNGSTETIIIPAGTGGASGASIDGDSFCTITGTGTINGPQIN